ncbi:MAG TPA: acylphosphatase [Saprospiraceae bacterium]|nr:acylphosphatase [Saprospiraceae bacterium]
MKTVQLQITGKVQGVWFRASAKDAALSLGLTGKVWNNPDDSVGAIAQGPEDKISEFIEWCKRGPLLARVEDVIVHEIAEQVNFTSFEISRTA